MLAGIITENEHKYNQLTGETAKMVRIIGDRGYQPTGDGAYVYVKTYAQIIDSEGNKTLREAIDSTSTIPLFYSNAELDFMFSSFNNPIEPSESFTTEFKNILQGVLLQDTMAKGYFSGDNCVPYVPIENN